MEKILFMGGVFNDEGGRPSSYIRKFTEALQAQWNAYWHIMNGGHYHDLSHTIENTIKDFDYLFWFCDVPNDKPKLVKFIKEQHPNIVLTVSKNNRSDKYTRDMLFERMEKAQAQYLLEFKASADGAINASLLSGNRGILMEMEPHIEVAAFLVSTLIKAKN